MIVVDTNILAYLTIPGERQSAAAALLDQEPEWAAPYLWRSEFRNILIGYLRRGAYSAEQLLGMEREAAVRLFDSEYQVDSRTVLELARKSGCTAYDCEFVALALDLGIPLVTMDRQILKAFPEIAVPLAA